MSNALDEPSVPEPRLRRFGWRLLWIGITLFVLGPVLGLLASVLAQRASFEVLEHMRAPTPADLSIGVHESLAATAIGLLVGLLGLAFVIEAALLLYRSGSSSPNARR